LLSYICHKLLLHVFFKIIIIRVSPTGNAKGMHMLALVKTASDRVLVERLKEAHDIVVGEEHVALVVIHDVVHAEQVYVGSATPSPPHRRM
jgi:hypothetical protein